MQIAKCFVFLCLFLGCARNSVYAKPGNEDVEGVDVIDGSFTQNETDLIVAGPEPLIVTRCYNSQETKTKFGGWNIFPQCHLSLESSEQQSFELPTDGDGKRIYKKHPSMEFYILEKEVLPSGNHVLYDYDELGQIVLVKMTNSSEEKIFSWIAFKYEDCITVETSDGKHLEYRFNSSFLHEVIRSEKPTLRYHYDTKGHLIKKEFLKGYGMEISYDKKGKVQFLKSCVEKDQNAFIRFVYFPENRCTEVYDPLNQKTVFRYDDFSRLTEAEQYLNESLYRVYSKTWDRKGKTDFLVAESIKDGNNRILHHKIYSYNGLGRLETEKEYGNLTGNQPCLIVLDQNNIPESDQDSHLKSYSYKAKQTQDIVIQIDRNGNGIRLAYKKGTKQLLAKLLLEEWEIKKRYFFVYDKNNVLVRQIIDDGSNAKKESSEGVTQRHLTIISPKQNLPNFGTPEMIEEKWIDFKERKKSLLSKKIYHFDHFGRMVQEDRYGSDGNFCYSLRTEYDNHDRVVYKTDPIGNEIKYGYDANDNLVYEWHGADRVEYKNVYDLNHHLLMASATDENGIRFQTSFAYDIKGNRISSIDLFGNETHYDYDPFGRLTSISFPEVLDEYRHPFRPIKRYEYDLLDHQISITDPNGNMTTK